MNTIKIIVADDEKLIHDSIDLFVSNYNKNKLSTTSLEIVKHFYNTDDLKDFLYEKKANIDLLLLDIEFKGGESGIEALKEVRDLAPILNITLLSSYDILEWIVPAQDKYNVKYLKKPISANELILHINEIKSLQKKIKDIDASVRSDFGSFIKNEKVINDLINSEFLYTIYMSKKEISSIILYGWTLAFEYIVKRKAFKQVATNLTLNDAINKLIELYPEYKKYEGVLKYIQKNRNRNSHPTDFTINIDNIRETLFGTTKKGLLYKLIKDRR